MSSINIVLKHLDQPELLTQLAEEAAELAQAALKLRRAVTGTNPTPLSPIEAHKALLEEVGDVMNGLEALGLLNSFELGRITRGRLEKMDRWAERLAEKEGK